MVFLLIISFILNVIYAYLLFGYTSGWKTLIAKSQNYIPIDSSEKISIIIPVRNEMENLSRLVFCIKQLEFHGEKPEIIFVNDHSTDESESYIKNALPEAVCLSLNMEYGKKSAISTGINFASGDWIVTIDADIYFEKNWLKNLIQKTSNDDPVMICGIVIIEAEKDKWLPGFQAMEFAVLQASGAAAIQQGHVLLNSGANLAFRKDAWKQVNGYSDHAEIASGDDTFLMIDMHKEFPGRVISNPLAVVKTSAGNSFADFMQQRIRWASKARFYDNNYIKKTGSIVMSSALTLPLILILAFFFQGEQNRYAAIVLWTLFLLRGIQEWRLLNLFASTYNLKFTFGDKLRMTLLYPFFLVFLLLKMPFSDSRWKGRNL